MTSDEKIKAIALIAAGYVANITGTSLIIERAIRTYEQIEQYVWEKGRDQQQAAKALGVPNG